MNPWPTLILLSLRLPLPTPQAPGFTPREAIHAEWARKAPALPEASTEALPSSDRARLERTLRRIGRPGGEELLPPDLAKPTLEVWLARAKTARTPRERFDALFFLNRLRSPRALEALSGLGPGDAAGWPRHLHLEAQVATARLNGGEPDEGMKGFLEALGRAGKVDPVRAQAARLRLVLGGKEKELLPPLKATPGSTLAVMDAWQRAPAEQRAAAFAEMSEGLVAGLKLVSDNLQGAWRDARIALVGTRHHNFEVLHRLLEGLPTQHPKARAFAARMAREAMRDPVGDPAKTRLLAMAALASLARCEAPDPALLPDLESALDGPDPLLRAALLPTLRRHGSAKADGLRNALLIGPHPIARAAALEDLPEDPGLAPRNELHQRIWKDREFEPQQVFIQSYARWKVAPEAQKAELSRWLAHPEWACRWEAYQALKRLDSSTPWPEAPKVTPAQKALLAEAERLATAARPVRLRLTFEGRRTLVLKLDPTVAPINIANLVRLARRGWFNGRQVPRVVPDFVVQMGSPYDTMDGGPGYTVRCESSLEWYGPGSVGMALSGKDTGGSQFFITTNATPHLTGKYTRMGEVEDLDRALPILDGLVPGTKILRVEAL